jgi:tol-pal system protein YbgF
LARADRGSYNSRIVRFVLAAALFAFTGCAGPATQLRRDKATLSEDVADLRAQLRKDQRQIRDLQTENLLLRDKMETAEVESYRDGVPRLPVEVIEPDADEAGSGYDVRTEYGDDARVVGVDANGYEIIYVGDAAAGKTVSYDDVDLGGDGEADDLEYAPDDDEDADADADPPPKKAKPKAKDPKPKKAPKPAATPADEDGDAATEYEAAVALVKDKDHDGAIAALRAFLVDHPRHDLADNAQYWLGEVYYDAKDWGRALIEFRATVEQYPRGNKVPDALLKMGYCYASLGQTAKARAALEQVVETYPKSQPAALAAKRLETL